jgi:hypothetical protein
VLMFVTFCIVVSASGSAVGLQRDSLADNEWAYEYSTTKEGKKMKGIGKSKSKYIQSTMNS